MREEEEDDGSDNNAAALCMGIAMQRQHQGAGKQFRRPATIEQGSQLFDVFIKNAITNECSILGGHHAFRPRETNDNL